MMVRDRSFHFFLQVPFLDVCNTLLHPILPLTAIDYEEFGFPVDHEEFLAIRKYSPYDNIQKDVPYPAVFVTSSFNTRYASLPLYGVIIPCAGTIGICSILGQTC
jgi:protease II